MRLAAPFPGLEADWLGEVEFGGEANVLTA